MYNIMLVSGIQQSDSKFVQIIFHYGHYKILVKPLSL